MIILMGQDDGFPTPLHPTPNVVFKKLMGVSSNLFGHGLAAGPDPDLEPDPAPLSSPPTPLGNGLAPPPPGHGNAQ